MKKNPNRGRRHVCKNTIIKREIPHEMSLQKITGKETTKIGGKKAKNLAPQTTQHIPTGGDKEVKLTEKM